MWVLLLKKFLEFWPGRLDFLVQKVQRFLDQGLLVKGQLFSQNEFRSLDSASTAV
jgi:hypothetical protein